MGVIDRPEESRFELPVEDTAALAYYRIDGNRFVLTHTEVPHASRAAASVHGWPRSV